MPTDRRLAWTLDGRGGESESGGAADERFEMEYVVLGETELGDSAK